MNTHQRIWIKHNGPIPTDKNGRRYELHHLDGNRTNNSLDNLKLVSVEEHLAIHEAQGDWGACALIAKRMELPPDYSSTIQKGKKRPGIGGAPKGRVPWNKGKRGYKLNCDRRGKRFSSKLNVDEVRKIRSFFQKMNLLEEFEYAKQKQRGGQTMSYEWFVAKHLSTNEYQNMTPLALYKILTKKTWADV